jgi:ABC-type xylose transport system, periplasmic component
MFKFFPNQRQLKVYLVLFLAIFILTASCNLVKTTSTPCNKIAILLPETGPAQRWEGSDRRELEHKIAKKLIDHVDDLMLLYFNADRNFDKGNKMDLKQVKQAERAFEQGVCLLIVGPVDETATQIVQIARQKNKPVIAYDRVIQDENKQNFADYFVSFDTTEVGRLQAKYIATELDRGMQSKYQFKSKDNLYVMINGSENDHNTKLLKQGFDQSLTTKIEAEVLKPIDKPFSTMKYIKDWDGALAAKEMADVLKYNPELKIAWVGNDGMASKIINKLPEDKKGKILITGQDGTQESLTNIQRGWQSMTVCKDSKDLAEKTALLVEALFKGEVNKSIPGLSPEKLDYTDSKSYISREVYSVVTGENFKDRVSLDNNDKIQLENTCKGKK